MPRDSNGNYSLPPIYLAVTGTTVLAEQHNVPLQDISEALTGSLPRNGSAPMGGHLPMSSYRITQLGNAVNSGDAVNLGQAQGIGVPVGTILDFAGTTVPTGYLMCFGQSLLRSEYPDLFAAIGTTYGSTSGMHFTVPDMRGRVGAGRDHGSAAGRLTNATMSPNGTTLGATGGEQTHTLTQSQMPQHSHPFSVPNHTHGLNITSFLSGGNFTVNRVSGGGSDTQTASGGGHSGNTGNTGSGQAHNNVQPTLIVNKIIKAFNA